MLDSTSNTIDLDSGLTTVSRIYCGLNRPDGGIVTWEDMQDFTSRVVAHEFPDGFTVLSASGAWRDMATGETIREPSSVIEIAHGSADTGKVMAIARAYKAEFGQQAVMVSSVPVRTTFV